MGATLDLTEFDAMMKEIYPDGVPEEVAYRRHVLLQKMSKRDDFEGDAYVVPIVIGGPQGRSAKLANAITNIASSVQKKFVITPGASNTDYVVWQIDARTLYASRSNKGSFARARKHEGDLALKQIGNSLANGLYGDGSGQMAQVASVSTNTMTLTRARDTRKFYVGMVLRSDDTSTGASPRTGTMTVTTIDPSAGTVTVGTIVSGTVADDYLFVDGDENNRIKGLAAWLPLDSPTSTAFWGVDRTVDVEKLSGFRLNNPGAGVFNNILETCENVFELGGMPDVIMLSPNRFNTLAKDTEATIERSEGGDATYGTSGFKFTYSGGTATVYADPDCPDNRGYVLTMDTWWIAHLEGLPHIVRDDGRDALRGATTDTIQMRARYWAEPVCNAPGFNGVCAL